MSSRNIENFESDSELDLSYIDEYGYEEEGSIHSTICSESDEYSTILDEVTSTTSEENNTEQYIYKNNKKTSEIWYHFDTTEQNQICKYCKKNYAKKTSTTILWRHYKSCHESEIEIGQNTSPPHPNNIMYEKTKSLVEWIICDLKSFSVVESESFTKLIYKLDSRYRLPSRHTIKRLISQEFEQKRDVIPDFLQNISSKFSLTCDIWSSIKMESFIAITLHYIDSNWKLCHFVLDIFAITGSHTGTSIFEKISQLISEMHLENRVIAITTDNGSNIVSGCKKLVEHFNPDNKITELTHFRCAAHVLNLAVNEGLSSNSNLCIKKLRKLIKKIRGSALLIDKLKHIFQSDNKKFLYPLLDIKTRWNSTFDMIERAIEIKLQLEILKI
jgi:hypothetical protein